MMSRTERAPPISAGLTVPELTVVIPTFNERANIAVLVERLRGVLAGAAWEAIFVDDDSPDGTAAVVKAARLRRAYLANRYEAEGGQASTGR